jgi:CheY-like chemotaxis protein
MKAIMVFSSDDALREIARSVLGTSYDVWFATSLQQMSRTVIAGIRPDLYIIEHEHPERLGCRVVEKIREDQPKAKCLVVSERDVAYDLDEKRYEIEGCCHNADAYLGIPYTGSDLEQTVKKLIG